MKELEAKTRRKQRSAEEPEKKRKSERVTSEHGDDQIGRDRQTLSKAVAERLETSISTMEETRLGKQQKPMEISVGERAGLVFRGYSFQKLRLGRRWLSAASRKRR